MFERLRKAREYLGLSQEYVAEQMGMSVSAIQNIESGQRRVSRTDIDKFSALYGVSANDLMYGPKKEEIPKDLDMESLNADDQTEVQNLIYQKNQYKSCKSGRRI